MMALTPRQSNPYSPFGLRTLHLFTLSGFAIAQPALTSLAGQSVYLHDQQFGLLEMLVLLTLLFLVLPLFWVLADQISQQASILVNRRGRNAVMGILVGILALSILRPYVCTRWMVLNATAGFTSLAAAIVSAVMFSFFYDRSSLLRSWLTFASAGLLIFPANFLWQFQAIQRAETSIENRVLAKKPTPVVFIVFDEFSGITLFNRNNELDAQRFPQFARLARMSTWYRNATTVNPRTDIAVPSILSGRYPVIDRKPLATEYPGNLLQVIEATQQFEMSVFEPVTRLCPNSVRNVPRIERTFEQKCSGLIQTVAAVYPRLILTPDTPVDLPRIPIEWFGLQSTPISGWQGYSDFTKGRFNYPGTEFRKKQQSHFLRCLEPAELPRFCFMHTVLPHYPWSFLPSGEQYLSEMADTDFPSGGRGELGEDWDEDQITVLRNEYRYRMQLGFVDRFIGQVIDRLEETGQIDKCLLIVMADHGVSFRPGNSRRLPGTDNLADILSVPLFIKFPGQTEGLTDDRNVETVDLFPTITSVLGIESSADIDGISVLKETRHLRKTFYFQEKMSIVEPDFPHRWPAIQRQAALYDSGAIDQISHLALRYPEWHGRSLESFEIEERTIPYTGFKRDSQMDELYFPSEISLSSNLIWGYIASDELTEKSADILLSIDGVVIDSTRTSSMDRHRNQFQFLIPTRSLEGTTERIELFVVNSNGSRNSLIRLDVKEFERSRH